MYLHEDKELFKDTITIVSERTGRAEVLVEKDYYVSLILKHIAKMQENCVFKGGTSLSKCFDAINRFSEDIDITFTEHLTDSKRKKFKYNVMQTTSETLGIKIANWEDIQSDLNVNVYQFVYDPIFSYDGSGVLPEIKLETSMMLYSYPVETMRVSNYIADFLAKDNAEFIEKYDLQPFNIKVQSLQRTFIDKIFALCDYYITKKTSRTSRHLYDLHKLKNLVPLDNSLKELMKEVRADRQKLEICPSAKDGVDIKAIVLEFCANDFFKSDYEIVTSRFVYEKTPYSSTVESMREIVSYLF